MILGSGFLADPRYALNPDAVATAGDAVSVQAEAGPQTLSIVVEGQAAARLREIAAIAVGAGAADALAVPGCPEDASRVMLVDHVGRETAEGIMLWPPERADAGGGPAPEIGRALRELVGIPVPRPLPPWRRRVSVLRLPSEVSESTLLAAAFRSPWTSWVTIGTSVFLVLEDGAQVAQLAEAGAERVAEDVELGQLRLASALPEGARALGTGNGEHLALCPAGCSDGTPWLDRRFDRIVERPRGGR